MSPVVIDSSQENQLSDEEYVIYRAKTSQKFDESCAKAWMITAKTLFPRNFAVQLEAYTSLKTANNPKEAARYFSSLFFDFPNEPGLWEEVQGITEALQSGSASSDSQFHRDLFSNMLHEVQHQLLVAMADRTEDTLEHCRLMLVLLTKFPQSVDLHGKKLVDTLLTAEKHGPQQNPVNCFRKLLIVDLLPILLNSKNSDVPSKTLYRLILKAVEFYVSWLSSSSSNIEGSVEPDIKPGESWNNLFQLMVSFGWKLGWELTNVFTIESNRRLMCQNLWTFYRSTPLENAESPKFIQLLYCTTVLLVESLYECFSKIDPNSFKTNNPGNKSESGPLVLVVSFTPNGSGNAIDLRAESCEPLASQSRLTISKSCSNSTTATLQSSFVTAVSCWELLHQTEELRNEFDKLCQLIRTDSWPWFPCFIIDNLMYQGHYSEAYNKLQAAPLNPTGQQSFLLKSSGLLFSLGNHVGAAEQVLHIAANLPECNTPVQSAYPPPSSIGKPSFHFMALNSLEVAQYCVSLLVACLREKPFRNLNEDLVAGHLIVLIQYDWPCHSSLLEEILAKIRRQAQFSYPLFGSYVVQIDILEEFMYLGTDQGGVINMDLFPSSTSQLATQRRMTTRCGDKGARDDFRSSMKRQTARYSENIHNTIMRFLVQEKELILQALRN